MSDSLTLTDTAKLTAEIWTACKRLQPLHSVRKMGKVPRRTGTSRRRMNSGPPQVTRTHWVVQGDVLLIYLTALMKKLSVLDRLLTPAILVCMVVGVLIGNYVPGVQAAFDTARFQSVSARKLLSLRASPP